MSVIAAFGKSLNTAVGVDVKIGGPVEKGKVEDMLQKCSTGACLCCDSEFLENFKGMSVSGSDGDVTIHIETSNVDSSEIEKRMALCDCYDENS